MRRKSAPLSKSKRGVKVGRRCKISSHSFLCEGVTLEDEVFIGHGVMFINDRYPRGDRGRTAPNRGRLGGDPDRGEARRLHRLECNFAVRRHDWRKRHRRRRLRCDQRRPSGLHRVRQSRPNPGENGSQIMIRIPFLDLRAQHDPIKAELLAAFAEVIDTSAFAGGPFVARFEDDFAAFCRTECAVGVGNGTDALWLALLARGIGPGDEVITVPNSFLATAEGPSVSRARLPCLSTSTSGPTPSTRRGSRRPSRRGPRPRDLRPSLRPNGGHGTRSWKSPAAMDSSCWRMRARRTAQSTKAARRAPSGTRGPVQLLSGEESWSRWERRAR